MACKRSGVQVPYPPLSLNYLSQRIYDDELIPNNPRNRLISWLFRHEIRSLHRFNWQYPAESQLRVVVVTLYSKPLVQARARIDGKDHF
jgi:hypothetical protein